MEITINVPDDKKVELIEAFTDTYNYQEKVTVDGEEVANPETAGQFAKKQIRKYIKDIYVAHKVRVFEEGRATELETADGEIDVITIS